jgi:ferredoxin
MLRKIVQIDEALCDGCGDCIPSCAEGAIALVGGKARLSADVLCDGLGACLGDCPRGAITVVEREAAPFDERAVAAHLRHPSTRAHTPPRAPAPAACPGPEPSPQTGQGCPGSRPRSLGGRGLAVLSGPSGPPLAPQGGAGSLSHWPVQLHLVPVRAPFFQGADLLVAADCVPFACPSFHADLLAGRALVVGCPKLDDLGGYVEKLTRILGEGGPRSVTVARMEVPCCAGLAAAARQAAAASGRQVPVREVVAGVDGRLRG